MHTKYLLRAGFVSIGLVALGCSSHKGSDPSANSGSAPLQTTAPHPAPSPTGNSSDGVSDLANQTAQYAQQVSPLLTKASASGKPTTVPSVVQWIDPNPGAGISDSVATAGQTPVAKATASPAIPPAKIKQDDPSIPLILPESADLASATIPPTPPNAQPAAVPSDDYERKLQQQVHDYPRDVAGQLDYQLLRLVRDEPSPDLQAEAGLPAEDREIVSALVDGISNFRSTTRADSNLLLSSKIQPLLEMADRLRSEAELEIPTAELCTSVQSFGVYTALPTHRLTAGAEHPVIVYCEVANFTSVQDEQKMWTTRINQEVTLYNDSGMQAWPMKSNATEFKDSAHTRRHDFYIARKIDLPANLPIGNYSLKVSLTDEQSNHVRESNIPIQIVGQ
jgi:hypothetical protein